MAVQLTYNNSELSNGTTRNALMVVSIKYAKLNTRNINGTLCTTDEVRGYIGQERGFNKTYENYNF